MTNSPARDVRVAFPSVPWSAHRLACERRSLREADLFLLAQTDDWLTSLPTTTRPSQLPLQFPRIINEMFRLWNLRDSLEDYFLEKVIDGRANRAGFPRVIWEELQALYAYSAERGRNHA